MHSEIAFHPFSPQLLLLRECKLRQAFLKMVFPLLTPSPPVVYKFMISLWYHSISCRGLSSLRQIWDSDVLVFRVRQLHPFKDLTVQVQTHTCGHFLFWGDWGRRCWMLSLLLFLLERCEGRLRPWKDKKARIGWIIASDFPFTLAYGWGPGCEPLWDWCQSK